LLPHLAYTNLRVVYWVQSDLTQAEAMYHKALELNEALGREEGMASAYGNLGNVYRVQGDLTQAEAMYRQSLTLLQEIGATSSMEKVRTLLEALRVQGSQ
jgi:tetratricopeptide (TPR) repeat protein